MKIVIEGVEYDGATDPCLRDMVIMNKVFGFGWATVAKRLGALDSDSDASALMEDPDLLEAMIAWIWASRRASGEEATRAEVEALRLSTMQFLPDDDEQQDEAVELVPTSASTGTQGADAPTPGEAKPSTRKRPSTKTPRQRSTAA